MNTINLPPPLIVIGGLPGHGKSVLAALLSRFTGIPWNDTSTMIYRSLAAKMETTVTDLRSQDKTALRPRLVEEGDLLCSDDPARLVGLAVEAGAGIVSGIRKPSEVEAVRDRYVKRGVVLVWVSALSPEEARAWESTDPDADPERIFSAKTVVDNTDPGIRQMADDIVHNLSSDHLTNEARYLALRYLTPSPK